MKRVLLFLFSLVTTLGCMSQETETRFVVNTSSLLKDKTLMEAECALKSLQNVEMNYLLLDVADANFEHYAKIVSHSSKRVFVLVNDEEEVDRAVTTAQSFLKNANPVFIATSLKVCQRITDQWPRSVVVYQGDDQEPKAMAKLGVAGVMYSLAIVQRSPELVGEAHQAKSIVMVNASDDLKQSIEMIHSRVDYVLTDDPYLLVAELDGKPLLKVMSFNVRYSAASKQDGENAWENRREAVVRMLNDQHPDLIGVQEMLPDQQQYLQGALALYKLVGVGRDDGKEAGECMGVFYNVNRFKLLNQKTYWLSQTPEEVSQGWDGGCKRTVTIVTLKDLRTDKVVCYLNTHLDHVGVEAREKSVKLLMELAAKVAPEDAVVVLGGDMNTEPEDPIFEPLVANGFSSARAMALQTDNIKSYNGYGKGTPSCIDQLYYRNTQALKFVTLTKNYGIPYVSDHYPVIGFFEL